MKITLIVICLTLSLAACGKKGPPVAPGPAGEATYPKSYPAY